MLAPFRAIASVVRDHVLPGTGITEEHFWGGFGDIVAHLGPKNRALLDERDRIQADIDAQYAAEGTTDEAFLRKIGYIVPAPSAEDAAVRTSNLDPEIAAVSAPQLVVPVDNARFVLNAANARWGSLMDAMYGTDVVAGPRQGAYNDERGALVFDRAHQFLDEAVPLGGGASYGDVTSFQVASGGSGGARSLVALVGARSVGLVR